MIFPCICFFFIVSNFYRAALKRKKKNKQEEREENVLNVKKREKYQENGVKVSAKFPLFFFVLMMLEKLI